ncbi:MAG: hypothetical protein FWE54_01310 [Methanimicrococcus sp.]|nr:hypothetical protein [Methanimicrococcus sp.]
MNGKLRYSGTEKIEKRIFDELEEKIEMRMDAIEDDLRLSVISEIREELQPETVPYDRLRLIEQRLHELSTTQDGIVREIVDLKTSLNALSKQLEKVRTPDIYEMPKTLSYEKPKSNDYSSSPSYSSSNSSNPSNPSNPSPPSDSPFSSYTPYPSATPEPSKKTTIPGFGGRPEPAGPATPISPVSFTSRKSDGWEYQEFVPAKKNNAEPEKFVPAKTIPASNDPFYFADTDDEILDVSALNESAAPEYKSAASSGQRLAAPSGQRLAAPSGQKPAAAPSQNTFSVQKIPKKAEPDLPDNSEYIIGTNKVKRKGDEDEDCNAGCEYIIAEKDPGGRKFGGRRGGKPQQAKQERVITNNDNDTDIFTYE